MFNWGFFISFWVTIFALALAGTWLVITMMCAVGYFNKPFRIIWVISSFLLMVIGTIIMGFVI